MPRRPIALLICSLLLPLATSAQTIWKWRDANGTVQISDQPPPNTVPEKAILSRPGAAPLAPAAAEAPTDPASTPARRDPALEARKQALQSAQRASEAQRQGEQSLRKEAQRQEACQRARANQATLDSGVRLARVNAQGEREFLDDQARAAEQDRVRQQMAAACR